MKHRTRSPLDVGSLEDGNAISGELAGEGGSSMVIFEGGDARSHYAIRQRGFSRRPPCLPKCAHSPGRMRCGCVSYSGWPNLHSAAETKVRREGRFEGLVRKAGDGGDEVLSKEDKKGGFFILLCSYSPLRRSIVVVCRGRLASCTVLHIRTNSKPQLVPTPRRHTCTGRQCTANPVSHHSSILIIHTHLL